MIRWPSGSGTLSARASGQMPSMPTPLAGAAATVLVAVPWKSRERGAARCRDVRARDLGVVDVDLRVDEADQRALGTDERRHLVADHEVAPARRGRERVGRGRLRVPAEPVRLGVVEQPAARSAAARARARGRGNEPGAAGDAARAVGARERATAAAHADDPGAGVRGGGGCAGVAGERDGRRRRRVPEAGGRRRRGSRGKRGEGDQRRQVDPSLHSASVVAKSRPA